MKTFPKSKYSFKQSLSMLFFYTKSNKLFMQTDSRAVWKKNTVGTPIRGLRRQCRVLLIQLLTMFSQLVSACFISLEGGVTAPVSKQPHKCQTENLLSGILKLSAHSWKSKYSPARPTNAYLKWERLLLWEGDAWAHFHTLKSGYNTPCYLMFIQSLE